MTRRLTLNRFWVLAILLLWLTPPHDARAALQRYGFEVIERLAHPRENFVQGLQIVGDSLYVGTGQYGESKIRRYDFPGMVLKQEVSLPDTLFGEGITRLGDRLYQLTWRAGQLREYDANTLDLVNTHPITTQGWGITHNGSELIYSDGTHQLYFLNPQDLSLLRTLPVKLGDRPLPRLNELEYIDDEIWANVWQANQLVRIDPASGAVTAIVDLRGLLEPGDREPTTDVLNGIAWDSEKRALWVTGKRWPWLFHIRLRALPGPQ